MNVRVISDNKNSQGTVSNGVPGSSKRTVLRAGIVSDEENQQNYGLNKMVVDGNMYDPATQTINAEGYVDLNQIPDENEGEAHEGDSAACTAWTTAGACVYGTEANNAQLNEINLTHAGPEFEQVEEPITSHLQWDVSMTREGENSVEWRAFRVRLDDGTFGYT